MLKQHLNQQPVEKPLNMLTQCLKTLSSLPLRLSPLITRNSLLISGSITMGDRIYYTAISFHVSSHDNIRGYILR